MTEQTDAAEVEVLTRIIADMSEFRPHVCTVIARAILASDWLAAREAAAEAKLQTAYQLAWERGAQAVLAAVEAIHNRVHWCFDADEQGEVFEDGVTAWPCPTLAAARAAAAAAGGAR